MPFSSLSYENISCRGKSEEHANEEVTDGHGIRSIVFTKQEGAKAEKDGRYDGLYEEGFALVSTQVQGFAEDNMVHDGRQQEKRKNPGRQNSRRELRKTERNK